ncbi:phytoene desaturase family protein [Filimonas effusa]|uniref:Phytoene desaturase n=1 Tax=Filimonas effusa TaxID=2508721 RepID=A0A4Q1D348_9BACT|nr:phytoene desaturase family protein [Filimonas effusa]RXK81832.1 phytoene desaturase [Filimonas effusa]
MQEKVVVIGSGFAGLSAACFLARDGYQVRVIEKNSMPGGRARKFTAQGFTFDMGPSWYWMPDVFERFFQQFGRSVGEFYSLKRLDPSYRIYWEKEISDIPADYSALCQLFESLEPGSSHQLDQFLEEAAFKYRVGMNKLVHKPGLSIKELFDKDLFAGLLRLDVFTSMQKHLTKHFKNEHLQQLMGFPVLFLGALPQKIPALYSLMNYADIKGGTWYPENGMYSIVDAMYRLAKELGVTFHFNETVSQTIIEKRSVKKLVTDKATYDVDIVVGGADYHHIETNLLPQQFRSYSTAYWDSRVMAPGCLIYYVGLNKKLENITHHSLFFDTSFSLHGLEIYEMPQWPSDPLFYVSAPSVTDPSVAPPGCENLFFLIPVASGLQNDSEELRNYYFENIVTRMEKRTGQKIKEAIIYKRSFAHSDFISEYNAFKGNAYGLANTLLQTAHLKPSCKSKKLDNLFYTGQLTVPGPGVPPSLISGELVATHITNAYSR